MLARSRPVLVLEHVPPAAALYGSSSEEIWELLAGLGYELLELTGGAPLTRDGFLAAAGTAVNWLARPSTAS